MKKNKLLIISILTLSFLVSGCFEFIRTTNSSCALIDKSFKVKSLPNFTGTFDLDHFIADGKKQSAANNTSFPNSIQIKRRNTGDYDFNLLDQGSIISTQIANICHYKGGYLLETAVKNDSGSIAFYGLNFVYTNGQGEIAIDFTLMPSENKKQNIIYETVTYTTSGTKKTRNMYVLKNGTIAQLDGILVKPNVLVTAVFKQRPFKKKP